MAGGIGTLLAEIVGGSADRRGVLVDAPGVVAQAETYLAGRGLSDRVQCVAGDMFAGVDGWIRRCRTTWWRR